VTRAIRPAFPYGRASLLAYVHHQRHPSICTLKKTQPKLGYFRSGSHVVQTQQSPIQTSVSSSALALHVMHSYSTSMLMFLSGRGRSPCP
jgi:hypothetical protein